MIFHADYDKKIRFFLSSSILELLNVDFDN